jgi:F0F1-type ATP synthase alpha subunit
VAVPCTSHPAPRFVMSTSLRPGEIKDILLREIEAADLNKLDVEEVGTVLEVKDGIARIYGLKKAMAGEMLEVTCSETHERITALALNLEEDNIGAVILGDYLQIKEGDDVRLTGRVLEVPVGHELLAGLLREGAGFAEGGEERGAGASAMAGLEDRRG